MSYTSQSSSRPEFHISLPLSHTYRTTMVSSLLTWTFPGSIITSKVKVRWVIPGMIHLLNLCIFFIRVLFSLSLPYWPPSLPQLMILPAHPFLTFLVFLMIEGSNECHAIGGWRAWLRFCQFRLIWQLKHKLLPSHLHWPSFPLLFSLLYPILHNELRPESEYGAVGSASNCYFSWSLLLIDFSLICGISYLSARLVSFIFIDGLIDSSVYSNDFIIPFHCWLVVHILAILGIMWTVQILSSGSNSAFP